MFCSVCPDEKNSKKIIALKNVLTCLIVIGLKTSHSLNTTNMWTFDGDNNYNFFINHYDAAFTLNTPGCSIPKMKLSDPSIQRLIHYPWDIPMCHINLRPLLRNNQTHIWVVKEHISSYDINQESQIQCCYQSFHQSLSVTRSYIDTVYLDCIMFDNIVEAANEFVRVRCYHNEDLIHKQFFVFIPRKKFNGLREKPFEMTQDKPTFNVIIMGLSSVSRLHMHRTMPNTLNLLSKLGAVELFGYHSIADNSLDNIMPILTGMNRNEIDVTYWLHGPVLDRCPYIWGRFKDLGYYTALMQDTARTGFFNSGLEFKDSPTDYFIHAFVKESASRILTVKEQAQALIKKWQNQKKRFLELWKQIAALKDIESDEDVLCMGNKYYFQVILEYIAGLTSILKQSKLFGFFWESSFHKSLNSPMVMDYGYKTLIQKLNDTGYLDETILIFLTDQGMNEQITETQQGRLERKLPFATILTPPAFRDYYSVSYENLKVNSHRLTSPFDIHKTIASLINMNDLENTNLVQSKEDSVDYQRGISLFAPIPANRTCESAGIGNNLCTCHKKQRINLTIAIVLNAVEYVITQLNHMLNSYPQCAQLVVHKILEFDELLLGDDVKVHWQEYRFEFSVEPGHGKFEALLRQDEEEWYLMTYVRRLADNIKEHSDCVRDGMIKSYCICQ